MCGFVLTTVSISAQRSNSETTLVVESMHGSYTAVHQFSEGGLLAASVAAVL